MIYTCALSVHIRVQVIYNKISFIEKQIVSARNQNFKAKEAQ
jgi:hypothetical protein